MTITRALPAALALFVATPALAHDLPAVHGHPHGVEHALVAAVLAVLGFALAGLAWHRRASGE